MPFDRDIGAELRRMREEIPRVIEEELDLAAGDLDQALEAGTPVRTGRLQKGWQESGPLVDNEVPYAPYVVRDTTAAEAVLEAVPRRLNDRVLAVLGG